MHPMDVLGDPVRRRLLEQLARGEASAGELTSIAQAEFGITQPAVSRQLRILREHGFAAVRPEGTRRWYRLDARGITATHAWLEQFWQQRLDALETELARGRKSTRQRRKA